MITGAVMVAVGTAISASSGVVMAVKLTWNSGRCKAAGGGLVQL